MNTVFKELLSDEKANELLAIGKIETLKKGDYFVRAGAIPKKIGFIKKGLFRYVYINSLGKQFTKGIILEDQFIASYSAMISNEPSYFFIEALEDSEVFSIPYKKWVTLVDTDPFWMRFLLKLVEKGFIAKEKRERELLLLNAETRYINFLKEYPSIEDRIHQTIIASYLGIQPESLSRIRKKIAT
ncbi:Cyclic nucleotide binding regulatory protein [Tenacibaculum litoreum]|uniref:Crp/Fnr family transcriptional regulator n=1 Tax=Tenacibaculum TaxID=104267 RepID=UPI0038964BFA